MIEFIAHTDNNNKVTWASTDVGADITTILHFERVKQTTEPDPEYFTRNFHPNSKSSSLYDHYYSPNSIARFKPSRRMSESVRGVKLCEASECFILWLVRREKGGNHFHSVVRVHKCIGGWKQVTRSGDSKKNAPLLTPKG